MTTIEPGAVVIMECGGRWPSTPPPAEMGAPPSMTAIVQQADESADDLRSRASRRVLDLARHGVALEVGVLSCGEASDEGALASRVQMAHAMASAMVQSGHGRLVLTGPAGIGARARHQLESLARSLAEQLGGTGVTVSVR